MTLQPIDRDIKLEVMALLAQGIKPIAVSEQSGYLTKDCLKNSKTMEKTEDVEIQMKLTDPSTKLSPKSRSSELLWLFSVLSTKLFSGWCGKYFENSTYELTRYCDLIRGTWDISTLHANTA